MTKGPEGAWFKLIFAALLSSICFLWRFGEANQWQAEAFDRLAPSEIIDWSHTDRLAVKDISISLRFAHTFGGAAISVIKGMGMFFDESGLSNTPRHRICTIPLESPSRARRGDFFLYSPLPVTEVWPRRNSSRSIGVLERLFVI